MPFRPPVHYPALLVMVLSASCAVVPPPSVVTPKTLNWGARQIMLSDGQQITVDTATLMVRERRELADSREIPLALIRLSRTNPAATTPTLFLDGAPDTGPSSSTITSAALYPFFSRLRQSGDVILMDYRGTGQSSQLVCPPVSGLPADLYSSRESALKFLNDQARTCAAALRSAGVGLEGYTWRAVAADVAEISARFGAPLNVLGFSSGTHAALITLREHPSVINRVVLIGTEGPDHTRKLPLAGDRQLAKIAALLRDASPVTTTPDFSDIVKTVLAKSEGSPFQVRVRAATGDSVDVSIGREGLAVIATKNLSGPSEFDTLVRLFATLYRGDLRVLTQVMQRLYSRPGGLNPANTLFDGSAGISRDRAAQLRREAGESVFGAASSFPFPEIQKGWGYADLGDAYRASVTSSAPALFITGALDGNTPPEQAEDIRKGFPNSGHLVVANAGHSTPLRVPAVAETIVDFFGGADVRGRALSAPPVRLATPR